jgi:hypothetical protein
MNIEISRKRTEKSSHKGSSGGSLSQKYGSINSQQQKSNAKSQSHLSEHEDIENNLLLEMARKYLLQEFRPSVMNIEKISREHTAKSNSLTLNDSSQGSFTEGFASVNSFHQSHNGGQNTDTHQSEHEVLKNIIKDISIHSKTTQSFQSISVEKKSPGSVSFKSKEADSHKNNLQSQRANSEQDSKKVSTGPSVPSHLSDLSAKGLFYKDKSRRDALMNSEFSLHSSLKSLEKVQETSMTSFHQDEQRSIHNCDHSLNQQKVFTQSYISDHENSLSQFTEPSLYNAVSQPNIYSVSEIKSGPKAVESCQNISLGQEDHGSDYRSSSLKKEKSDLTASIHSKTQSSSGGDLDCNLICEIDPQKSVSMKRSKVSIHSTDTEVQVSCQMEQSQKCTVKSEATLNKSDSNFSDAVRDESPAGVKQELEEESIDHDQSVSR